MIRSNTGRKATLGAILFAGLGLLSLASPADGQIKTVNNEREITPEIHQDDKQGIWALQFRFKEPRVVQVNIPGRGTKYVWYMWYQVSNKTGEPRTFFPFFDLIAKSDKDTLHYDEILPTAQDAIRKLESPTLPSEDFFNSVTISERPIPATQPEAAPRVVTGVAMWSDITERNPRATHYEVYVTGLSNGWSKDANGNIRRKTLQLNFKRGSDGRRPEESELRFMGYEWKYRVSSAGERAKEQKAADEKK